MGQFLRLFLSLVFFISVFTLFGAAGWGGYWIGWVVGGLVGVFFGLVFGGVRARWLDQFYPPND